MSWKPTTKTDWLFEENWRCRVTGNLLEKHYLIKKENVHSMKRDQKLLVQLVDMET
jgi:hypothetical protein